MAGADMGMFLGLTIAAGVRLLLHFERNGHKGRDLILLRHALADLHRSIDEAAKTRFMQGKNARLIPQAQIRDLGVAPHQAVELSTPNDKEKTHAGT